jgi:hypothetical protein
MDAATAGPVRSADRRYLACAERTARTALRRGPVPAGPQLGADERRHVITHMQAIAERADRRTTGGLLLARQAYYLIGFDASPETMAWLAQMYRTDRRVVRPARGWSPNWAPAPATPASRSATGRWAPYPWPATTGTATGRRRVNDLRVLSIPRSGISHGTSSSRSSGCSCQVRLYYEGLVTSPAVRRVLD